MGVAIHLTAINGSISIRRLNVTLFPYAHGYSYSNNIWQNDRDHLLAFTLNVPFSHWMRTDSQSAFRNSNASYSMSNDLKGGMTNLSG
ncbi:hypothetical protein ACSFU7_005226, partial [Escherichia coli]